MLGMGKNEIQPDELGLDGIGLAPALIWVVFIGQKLVHGTGAKVIDQCPVCRTVDPDVTLRQASSNQTFGA